MSHLVVFGESMVEFSQEQPGLYRQSFAGDVHSLAVYFKRAAGANQNVSLLSAVGQDAASEGLLGALASENIDRALTLRHPTRQLGLYLVNTDHRGERSFSYWRGESAARETFTLLFTDDNGIRLRNAILEQPPERFMFSGISLAILDAAGRAYFWEFVDRLRETGTTVIFDPNYRPRLWASPEETRREYARAFRSCNIVLPGIEDLEALYGVKGFEAARDFLAPFDIDEMVIKDGPNGVFYCAGEAHFLHAIEPVANVVDTTAAGDSFNGTYLAARASGASPHDAIQHAAQVAALVIQHRGALVDHDIYQDLAVAAAS